MNIIGGIGIGIVTGCIGWIAIPLSHFLCEMDKEPCSGCKKSASCFARKNARFFKTVNLYQWMLLTYWRVRKRCDYASRPTFRSVFVYMIANCILVSLSFWSKNVDFTGILYAVATAALLSLSVVDWCTQYIPFEMSGVIFLCGLIHLFADFSNWVDYIIGLFAVSGFLLLVDKIATPVLRKRYGEEEELAAVIGDGDIKLMAATGLLIGWRLNFLALGIGCIAGSVIHLIRMKIKGSSGQLALGPYLSLGIYVTMICGEQLISWYLNMLGIKPI